MKGTGMFGLFRRKPQPRPEPKYRPDDATMSELATMISDLLSVQIMILPSARIEDEQRNIFPKSIGYVYGYTDAFLTGTGYNMSDLEVGPPITFHVFRKLFDAGAYDAQRYIDFLMNHMQDQTVALGMIVGGQQFIDYTIKKHEGAPMGLARFVLEEQALAGQTR
jgi:hypothetical protein